MRSTVDFCCGLTFGFLKEQHMESQDQTMEPKEAEKEPEPPKDNWMVLTSNVSRAYSRLGNTALV